MRGSLTSHCWNRKCNSCDRDMFNVKQFKLIDCFEYSDQWSDWTIWHCDLKACKQCRLSIFSVVKSSLSDKLKTHKVNRIDEIKCYLDCQAIYYFWTTQDQSKSNSKVLDIKTYHRDMISDSSVICWMTSLNLILRNLRSINQSWSMRPIRITLSQRKSIVK
jgi:hypothetical protein